ncbi:response regulator [Allokutzneria sp. NRRL B-24872]|uniref:response regulator n=1 Tax=Allokutzneria sp. NRRL B-24872 TaxID=1137961 RepID=UPI002738088D|nr:response regulator [Allokutzneria sp. NRRL B-24872]
MDVRVLLADDHSLLRQSFRALLDGTPGFTAVGEAGTGADAVRLAAKYRPDIVLMDVRMPVFDGIEATRRICADPSTAGSKVIILTTFDLDEYVYAALRAGASGFLVKDTTAADLLAAIRVVAQGEALLAPAVTRRLIAEFARRPEPGPASRPSPEPQHGHRSPPGQESRHDRESPPGQEAPTGQEALPGQEPQPGQEPEPGHEGVGGQEPESRRLSAELDGVTPREREVLTLIAHGLSNGEIAQKLFVGMGTVKTHVGRLLDKLRARDRAQLVIAAYRTGLVSVPDG